MSVDEVNEDRIYQDDRLNKIKEYNNHLLKALACVRHQKHGIARDCLNEASYCGLDAVRDNNQFYTKEIYNTYNKYYAVFKKLKYLDGARCCLLQATVHLKKMTLPKEKKIKVLASIVKKYEDSNGDVREVKASWENPSIQGKDGENIRDTEEIDQVNSNS
jgi:hypothetical protein